jgi:two-component system, OmpR family, response regulator MtrA
VEDDASIREIAALGLQREGFLVATEQDGRRAVNTFSEAEEGAEPFDLVVLDIMLPSLGGLEVCRAIRERARTPVIMVTAKTTMENVVAGLEAGADDYIRKPFDVPELIARVRAVLRRAQVVAGESPLRVGDVEIDPAGFRVCKGGREIQVSATEFRLLVELVRQRGEVVQREMLLERVWGHDYLGDSRMVDMAIKRLRDKIEDDPHRPTLVHTIRGVGYRLRAE